MINKIKKALRLAHGFFSYNVLSKLMVLPPKRLLIVLTYRCNSRCVMCNIWKMKPGNELSLSEWENILKDPIFKHIEKITLTGGEPLLAPDYIQLVKLFIKSMPKLTCIDAVSNGFATEIILKKVKDTISVCKPRGILFCMSVSLDGIGDKHEEIRRIPNAYNRTTKTILRLKTLEKNNYFYVSVGSVIMRQTLSEVEKLQHWSKKTGVPQSFQIVGFHDSYVHNLDRQKDINFARNDKKQLLPVLSKLGTSTNWREPSAYFWKDVYFMYAKGLPRSTPCPFVYDEFTIDALGNVYYCLSERAIGNTRNTQSVSDIYFDKKNISFRNVIRENKCRTCNSKCGIERAVAFDAKKYLWFLMTNTPWYGLRFLKEQVKNFK